MADSLEPSTLSRVRLKSRACLRTAPATTSPTCCPCRPKRATRPSSVAVSMSWFDASAYFEFERANGMRLPPTIAACRVAGFWLVATGTSGCRVGWPVPTVSGTVSHMKAEAVRRPSQEDASEHKIAHVRDRRDSRWDEHRRARREQLVDAAVAAVGKHGAGVGMEEIAAEAGTSKTVVYRHFTDRTDLHVAVCSRVADQLLPKLREAMGSSIEPRQMVAAAIETYLIFLEADPELYRFVVHG